MHQARKARAQGVPGRVQAHEDLLIFGNPAPSTDGNGGTDGQGGRVSSSSPTVTPANEVGDQ
jgi:hypothetical protein